MIAIKSRPPIIMYPFLFLMLIKANMIRIAPVRFPLGATITIQRAIRILDIISIITLFDKIFIKVRDENNAKYTGSCVASFLLTIISKTATAPTIKKTVAFI